MIKLWQWIQNYRSKEKLRSIQDPSESWVLKGPESSRVLGPLGFWILKRPGSSRVLVLKGPGSSRVLGALGSWVLKGPGSSKLLGPLGSSNYQWLVTNLFYENKPSAPKRLEKITAEIFVNYGVVLHQAD